MDIVPASGRVGIGTNVSEWVSAAQTQARPTLFLLDLCRSGRAARLPFLLQHAGRDTHAWVLAASGGDEDAYDGRFSRAVADVLDELSHTGLGADITRRYVAFSVVARHVRRRVEAMPGVPQTVFATAMDLGLDEPELPFFPNPRFRADVLRRARHGMDPPLRAFLDDLADIDGGDAEHFTDRAGHHFVGRRSQLRLLAPWLDDDAVGGLRVVTGSPGVGKSAILGALVCAAHGELRTVVPHVRARLQAQDPLGCPSVHVSLAAVHARERHLNDVVASIARQLKLPTPADGWHAQSLIGAIATLPVPPPIVLDALDEAVDPESITTNLLLPLARATRSDGRPICRLLVGMRPWEQFRELRDRAAAEHGLIDLDTVAAEELRADLADHLTSSFGDLDNYAAREQRTVREHLAAAVAARLTSPASGHGEWGAFLVGSLFTRYVHNRLPARDVVEADRLGSTVPTTLPDVLALDLNTHARPDALRAVLAAASHAKGDGMPAELIALLAMAFHPESGSDDIQDLLDHDARFYLRTSMEQDGTTLYRLFHQGLTDYLRRTRTPGGLDHSMILDRLLGPFAPTDAPVRQTSWAAAPQYLLRHAIEHAVDAGRADELATDADFLLHADLNTLMPALDRAESEPSRRTAAVFRASWEEHQGASADERRQLLAIDAARQRHSALRASLATLQRPGAWHPLWATNAQTSDDVRMAFDHRDSVGSLAAAEVDGRPVVITGSEHNGAVRVWDVRTGHLRTEIQTGLEAVKTMACATVRGRPVVVTANNLNYDGKVRVWDVATGRPHLDIRPEHFGAKTIACTELDGRPVVVTADGYISGHVWAWDLITGRRVQRIANAHEGSVEVLTCTTIDGRAVVVTAGYQDGLLKTWDLTTGRPLHTMQVDSAWKRKVICAQVDGLPMAVVGGSELQVWDLTTGHKHRTIATGPARSVTVTIVAGRPIAVCGDPDGAPLQAWDLSGGQHWGDELSVRERTTQALTMTVDGQPLAVTANQYDRAVRVWKLAPTPSRNTERLGHADFVTSVDSCVIDGDEMAVSGSMDGTLQVWDLATGRPVGDRLTGDGSAVRRVVCTEFDGRPVAVTSGEFDGLRIWDLRAGRPYGRPLISRAGPVRLLACTELRSDLHAVTSGHFAGPAKAWNLRTGRPFRTRRGEHTGADAVACLTQHGRPVVVSGGGYAQPLWVWDLETGEPAGQPVLGLTHVRAATVASIDGRLALATARSYVSEMLLVTGPAKDPGPYSQGAVHLWDLATGQAIRDLGDHADGAVAMSYVECDGRQLAVTGGGRAVRFWDLGMGREETLRIPAAVGALTFTADGHLLLGAGCEVIVMHREGGGAHADRRSPRSGELPGGRVTGPGIRPPLADLADESAHRQSAGPGTRGGLLRRLAEGLRPTERRNRPD
ncbi:hypothetical protein ABT063_48605 [Streptomyces sp. NPDC002838]|uniref:hypothetical protein n=1 Tax=Streptomyces sp. NPDC002838 TaxID=3154436 RepID=UPI00331A9B25